MEEASEKRRMKQKRKREKENERKGKLLHPYVLHRISTCSSALGSSEAGMIES
jgi:hypothetical protein